MATAKAIPNVELELTAKEASVLMAVLRKIGGDPQGPRGAASAILTALEDVGVQRADISSKATEAGTGLYIS
jgi:hypothetical protein